LPEQRLFLRSDRETRFVRLRPLTQAVTIGVAGSFVAWSIVATSVLLMNGVGAGNLREQVLREQAAYQARLNDLASERDQRAAETQAAHERFGFAMERISEMQSALLASEEHRMELETGIDVIQRTLHRTVNDRDTARNEAQTAALALATQTGSNRTDAGRSEDVAATLDFLMVALERTSAERDTAAQITDQATNQMQMLALENRLIGDRNNRIFSQLEQAVEVSMVPLERMFRDAGLPPERILEQVRSGYDSRSAALTPIAISTSGTLDPNSDEARANNVLSGLEEIDLYRIAALRAPFGRPTSAVMTTTSNFGNRRDPITGATRMHSGVDFGGSRNTPILATADARVKFAGRQSGYGNIVILEHDFGIETYYAHLNTINVSEGQRVSRGDRIGGMGTTGRSTGVHLHYEVRVGGRPVNPMTYIRAAQNVF
jgi:murein DD-endopeptidase MepM/ murein hydrolase activator NlpD